MSNMKNLRTLVLCACITFCGLFSAAQNQNFVLNEPDHNKPRIFDNLPGVLPVSIENLNSLINSKPGERINTSFSNDVRNIPFEGNVFSAVSKYGDKVQTVMIKSTNYIGASLYISKVVMEDGSVKYNGRIMGSFQNGDIYVLRQNKGLLEFTKKNYYDVINE